MTPDTHAASWRTVVMAYFEKRIYGKALAAEKLKLANIASQNSRLLGNSQRCFSFKNKVYREEPYRDEGILLPKPVNKLDTSLVPALQQYEAAHQELRIEMRYVLLGYLAEVVTRTCSLADIKQLVPATLHQGLQDALQWLTREPLLAPTEIEQILNKNEKYIAMLKQRLVLSLLEN